MERAPDGFPGCLVLWKEILASLLDWLRRELYLLLGGSVQLTCPEHYLGGGWEPGECEGCPYEEKCNEA
jgi:hypothetical protein